MQGGKGVENAVERVRIASLQYFLRVQSLALKVRSSIQFASVRIRLWFLRQVSIGGNGLRQ